MLLRRLVILLAVIALAPRSAGATPIVFASADGMPSGPAGIPLGGGTHILKLWFDPGEGFFDFILSFSAGSGLELLSFTPDPGISPSVELDPGDGGTLSLLDGSTLSRVGPLRVGELSVQGLIAGATLRLVDLANVIAPSYVNEGFEVVEVPTPQLIAIVVPEVSTAPLLGLGTLGLVLIRRVWLRKR